MIKTHGQCRSVFLRTVVPFLLSLILLIPLFALALLPAGAEISPALPTEPSFSVEHFAALLDFSDPDDVDPIYFTPEELLTLLCEKTGRTDPTDAECSFLSAYSDCVLSVTTRLPLSSVTLEKNGDILTFSADSFSYSASNGKGVCVFPDVLLLGDISFPFTLSGGSTYSCAVSSDEIGGNVPTVRFSVSFAVPADAINALFSFARVSGEEADALLRSLNAAADEYLGKLAAYENYLLSLENYRVLLGEYDNYLAELQSYRIASADYADYLARLSEYETDLAEYRTYLDALAVYETEKKAYDDACALSAEAREAYTAYVSSLGKIRDTLTPIESLWIKPSNGTGTLYRALQNQELVGMFLKYRDKLEKFLHISGKTMDALKASAEELNVLLAGYDEARSVSEEAAFAYYSEHYAGILSRMKTLYYSLMEMMTPTCFNYMCSWVELEYSKEEASYKKWRIKNVLSHISLTVACLDDTVTAGASYAFYADNGDPITYYYKDLVAPNVIVEDKNCADPAGNIFPTPVESVILPDPPVRPIEVMPPVMPTPVGEPTEPTEVEKPTEPAVVPSPGKAPGETGTGTVNTELLAAYRAGLLPVRENVSEDVTLTFDAFLAIPLPETEEILLLDADGKKNAVLSPEGGKIVLPLLPERPCDELFTFTPVGWEDSNGTVFTAGTEADASSVAGKILRPVYEVGKTLYSVTVVTPEGEKVLRLAFGETPSLPASPEKEATAEKVFPFEGWSPACDRVTGDVTYTAVFGEETRFYSVRFADENGSILGEQSLPYGALPTPPSVVTRFREEDGMLVSFLGFGEIVPVSGDVTYTASFSRESLLPKNATQVSLADGGRSVTLRGDTLNIRALVTLCRTNGEKLTISFADFDALVSFSRQTVSALYERGAETVSLLSDDGGLHLRLLDGEGKAIGDLPEFLLLLSSVHETEGYFRTWRQTDDGYRVALPYTKKDGAVEWTLTSDSRITFEKLRLFRVETEGGYAECGGTLFAPGEKLAVTLLPANGYVFESAVLLFADGRSVIPDNPKYLAMPDEDCVLRVTFRPVTYTVRFVSLGETVSETEYAFGDTVALPEMPTGFIIDGEKYEFLGWSPRPDEVTGNATYVARYSRTPVGYVPQTGEAEALPATVKSLLPYAILGVTVVALSVIAVILAVRLFRKKKKRR